MYLVSMATNLQCSVKFSYTLQYNSKTIQSIFMKFSGKIDIVLLFTYNGIVTINQSINQCGFHTNIFTLVQFSLSPILGSISTFKTFMHGHLCVVTFLH